MGQRPLGRTPAAVRRVPWGVFRGHPLAIPLGYPSPPREKVSLRSPLPDGGKASSGTEVPIQEATTENRFPPWVLIDKSPGHQQSFCPRVSPPAVQPAGIIHILLSTMQAHVPGLRKRSPFLFSPESLGGGGKPHGTACSLAGPTEEAHR